MGKEGKGNGKRNYMGRIRLKDRCSDDSDEDYVVSNEEEEESEADLEKYCSSSDGAESQEGFCSLIDEEDNDLDVVHEERKRKRKFARPKPKEDVVGSGKKIRSRKRNMVVSEEEEEEEEEDGVEDEDDGDYEEEEDEVVKERRKSKVTVDESRRIRLGMRKRVSYDKGKDGEDFEDVDEVERPKVETFSIGTKENGIISPGIRKCGSNEKEKEDDRDYEQEFDDDDDDDEFILDDDVSLEEEDEEELVGSMNKKKNNLKAGKRSKQKRRSGEGRKRRKKNSARKQPVRKRGRKKQGRKRKRESDEDDCGDFIDDSTTVRKNAKKKSVTRSKRNVLSDSDFISSGPSDYEFTISEEEREQVREASKLLRTTSRTISSSSTKNQENADMHQIRKPPVKKGKEKVEIAKREVVKQVCGICLSEEDKRRLRGTLDCCSHYFCFTCIMEWSKVESRCPLCKQRFKTISKPSRSTPGVDLREVLISVPERDQVYQPTEEELRSYLDPYENVICTECHQGGDDGLMLLCDLCDSSAHTYCVGLGREVPEGSWYCEGCKPVALAFSGSEAPNPAPDHRTANNRPPPFVNSGDFIDPALLSSPHNPIFHGFGNLPSPRFPNTNNILETSPSGSGAPTLSRRRTIHRHIQNLMNANRFSNMVGNGRTDETSNAHDGLLTPQVDRGRESVIIQPMRTQQMITPLCSITEDKPLDIFNNPSSSAQVGDLVCSISGNLRGEEAAQLQTNSAFTDWPVNLGSSFGLIGNPHVPSYEQFQLNSCSAVYRVASEGDFSVAREQLQLAVKTHLRNLSSQNDLGQGSFNEIATCSIHTILAACGLEHRSNLVHAVPPPVKCSHFATLTAAEQASNSLMKGCCISCFDSFVKDVVKMIMDTRNPQWLSLGL